MSAVVRGGLRKMDEVPFVKCATCGEWHTPFGMKSHVLRKGHKMMRVEKSKDLFPFAKGVA